MARIAITREVSPGLDRCELTHLGRFPIDPERAARQHASYEAALRALGCRVRRAPPAPEHPDGVFVEDAVVVLDELAILTRSGAASRRAEVTGLAVALSPYRPLRFIDAPGTLDGGDVLQLGRTVYVGASARTNASGAAQLRSILAPLGYEVRRVAVAGCLHLKSAVTRVADDAVLLHPDRVDAGAFDGWDAIVVDPSEPGAANALRLGETVLVSASGPRTRERLESAGIATVAVDVSELEKAEAGVTCCSVLFDHTESEESES